VDEKDASDDEEALNDMEEFEDDRHTQGEGLDD